MAGGAYQIELTQGAESDLQVLYDYVAEHRSPEQAEELLDTLLKRIASLERFPERGAIPKELAALGISEFRQLLIAPYRLIYRVIGRSVFISVIADGRRDMQALLQQRLLGT
jgi:toxin ParE1/3/4